MVIPHLFPAFSKLCSLCMQGSVTPIRCEWWMESEGLPEACRDTLPVRAHRDSSSSAQSILEARPQTIWGRDAQTQHFWGRGNKGWERRGAGEVGERGGGTALEHTSGSCWGGEIWGKFHCEGPFTHFCWDSKKSGDIWPPPHTQ